jgi:hypothetical protein
MEGNTNAEAVLITQDLIDASQNGDYAALMTQFHLDYFYYIQEWITGTLAYAQSFNIPMWNADNWLVFTETRYGADYTNIMWNGISNTLTFDIDANSVLTQTLTTMVPNNYQGLSVQSVSVDSSPASYTIETIKGVPMVFIPTIAGNHSFVINYSSTPNLPPYTPNSPSPSDTATDQSINTTLTWSGGDPDVGNTVTYDVYLEANNPSPSTQVCNDVSIESCDPATLSPNTQYYWYVISTDNLGASSTGPTWSFTTASDDACVMVDVVSSWNLVSVPVETTDMSLLNLFPDITPPAYSYIGSYQTVSGTDLLQAGQGYWMWFDSPRSYEICGQVVASTEIPVNAGWNMIGPFDTSIAVSAITSTPADILDPSVYGYDGSYTIVSTLTPGKGFWAFANQTGTLNLGSGGSATTFSNP